MMVVTPMQFAPAEVAHESQTKRCHQVSEKRKNSICVLERHRYRLSIDRAFATGWPAQNRLLNEIPP